MTSSIRVDFLQQYGRLDFDYKAIRESYNLI